jgi:SPP1 family phage portal protein
MQIGRYEIFTDEREITRENIIDVLQKAVAIHEKNVSRMDFLLRYDAGEQPIHRNKTYRSDINCECVDNVANEITEFNLGFKWAFPITLVQRGNDVSKGEAISWLNNFYETQNIREKTQKLGRYIEICGIGYTYVDKAQSTSVSPFKIEVLDPLYTFVVRSNYYIDKRIVMGVVYRKDSKGNKHFTCFTDKLRFEIENFYEVKNGEKVKEAKWNEANRSGEINPLGMVPIIEWFRGHDRMGCFERQISEMDNLNLLISDFTNDVEQNTQAIWHANDVDFPTEKVVSEDGSEIEMVKRPKTNDWMQTFTTQDGKTPFVKPLAIEYDYSGMLNNIITRRSLILQKCNVPQRNDNSGGSTGIAMSDATGWSAAETSASKQQNITECCKMEEVKVVLKAISLSSGFEELKSLTEMDIQPSIKRQKNYELTTKVNFFATAVSHGIDGLHALKAMNAFEDVNQVWEDSKELIEKYQSSIFDKQEQPKDRLEADYSDQKDNSPMLNG